MKTLSKIENYLDGNLSGKELSDFERLLEENNSLREETLLCSEINESIRDTDTEEFRDLVGKLLSKNDSKLLTLRFVYYAAASIIIALSLFRITNYTNPDKVYSAFYSPYTTNISVRSDKVTSTENIEFAYKLYGEGKYQASFEMLSEYNDSGVKDENAVYYEGLCALELEKYNLAEDLFSSLLDSANPALKLHVKWYISLTYLKTNNKEKSIEILSELAENKNFYTEKAKKLLKKVK